MDKNEHTKPKANTDAGGRLERIVRNAGQAYYFPHETVKKYEAGEIEFIDESGRLLKPSYFGAGMNGMNGTLKAS